MAPPCCRRRYLKATVLSHIVSLTFNNRARPWLHSAALKSAPPLVPYALEDVILEGVENPAPHPQCGAVQLAGDGHMV